MKTALIADLRTSSVVYDLPSILRERLRAAVRRNPHFSLRSFSRQLGIDHSTLSQILRGKRRLSTRALDAVGKRMGLSAEVVRAYEANVRSFHFDLDTFQLLSVWHHYAILELIQVQAFKPDSRWIANTLGIALEDVNIALQRLLRLGLLEMSGRSQWTDKSGDAEFQSASLTEAACNQMNREIHELAVEAIEHIPSQHRAHRQVVFAFDSRKLPRLKLLADEFMKDLRSLAADVDTKDDVYQVEISLFPVTTLKKTKGEKNG